MKYLLCLGSNTPDGDHKIAEAAKRLGFKAAIVRQSPVYATIDGKYRYLNQIIELETGQSPDTLKQFTRQLETDLGRRRPGDTVAIDIDIVTAGDTILRPTDYDAPYFRRGINMLYNINL